MASARDPALAADVISWTMPVELGSVARSEVSDIVAGPGGFVATGLGFDNGQNQGRVWFTVDGQLWEEPAFELFDTKLVGPVAATADAFYVVAITNADRTPEDEGEANPTVGDSQLYRSADGRNWEPWGEPIQRPYDIAATADTLLRTAVSGFEWSPDGLEWSEVSLESSGDVVGQISSGPLVTGDPNYLHGFDDGSFTIWTSTDGRSWSKLPEPPTMGFVVAHPDGPLLFSNTDTDLCLDDLAASPVEIVDLADQQWACGSPTEMHQLDEDTSTWIALNQSGPGPTPSYTPIVRLGEDLVAAVTEPSKALTVWTAPISTLQWQPHTTYNYAQDLGSPGHAHAASSTTHVIIVTQDRAADGKTGVIVGSAQNATEQGPLPSVPDDAIVGAVQPISHRDFEQHLARSRDNLGAVMVGDPCDEVRRGTNGVDSPTVYRDNPLVPLGALDATGETCEIAGWFYSPWYLVEDLPAPTPEHPDPQNYLFSDNGTVIGRT